MIALKKTISVERGQHMLFPEQRYFFYITNCRDLSIAEVVATWSRPRTIAATRRT